jgi:hypothetical protein
MVRSVYQTKRPFSNLNSGPKNRIHFRVRKIAIAVIFCGFSFAPSFAQIFGEDEFVKTAKQVAQDYVDVVDKNNYSKIFDKSDAFDYGRLIGVFFFQECAPGAAFYTDCDARGGWTLSSKNGPIVFVSKINMSVYAFVPEAENILPKTNVIKLTNEGVGGSIISFFQKRGIAFSLQNYEFSEFDADKIALIFIDRKYPMKDVFDCFCSLVLDKSDNTVLGTLPGSRL